MSMSPAFMLARLCCEHNRRKDCRAALVVREFLLEGDPGLDGLETSLPVIASSSSTGWSTTSVLSQIENCLFLGFSGCTSSVSFSLVRIPLASGGRGCFELVRCIRGGSTSPSRVMEPLLRLRWAISCRGVRSEWVAVIPSEPVTSRCKLGVTTTSGRCWDVPGLLPSTEVFSDEAVCTFISLGCPVMASRRLWPGVQTRWFAFATLTDAVDGLEEICDHSLPTLRLLASRCPCIF
mmetsp:Transcript_11806/g.26778  ORF Transcript_11806/g.26778 Transcript_11806/m.26778 type:complete len:236 (-) Transcript_11806:451-1158(-)